MSDLKDSGAVIDRLYETIVARKGADPKTSYSAKLFAKGIEKCAQKLGEEAVETVIAAVAGKPGEVAEESADLLYHLLVVWAASGVKPSDVYAALEKREGTSGIDEKASRKS